MISAVVRAARVGSVGELAAATALIVVGFPALMITALLPSIPLFVAAAVVTYGADHYLHRRKSYLLNRLSKVRAGLAIRFLVRQLILVMLLARLGLADGVFFYALVACFIGFYGLQAVHGALATLVRLRCTLPVATRNIVLESSVRTAGAPPRFLLHRAGEKMLHLDLPVFVGGLVSAALGDGLWGGIGIAATLGLGGLYTLFLLPYLIGSRRPPTAASVLAAVETWLREHRPETVLYFSGSKDSAYQVNMWLETMERLETRPLIILRERSVMERLAPTTVPVICVPGGVHLMNMDLSTVRVALYAANVGKNIHLLRVPTMKHVFIGHGDSDKIASVNPYSKVYDEVWTAGKAGRDRYAVADVGVRDEDIVEVGRPQLAPILPGRRGTIDVPTVLYAPTWEGWDDNPGNTSLMSAGENIVRRLLTAEEPVRVLYKPHPFTGTRSPRAAAAHARITEMVERAAAERAQDPRFREDEAALREARAELAALEAQLAELSGAQDDGDEGKNPGDGAADPVVHEEIARLRRQWNDVYWRSFPEWEHRVITGPEPLLYDCFNVSDAMVSDISSVVSDFIASGKPYAVTDSAGLGVEEFVQQNTAVRAAVILSNEAGELDELLAAVRDPAADNLAAARIELKEYLLGPDEPPSIVRFNAAIAALALKAEARNLGQARSAASAEVPAAH